MSPFHSSAGLSGPMDLPQCPRSRHAWSSPGTAQGRALDFEKNMEDSTRKPWLKKNYELGIDQVGSRKIPEIIPYPYIIDQDWLYKWVHLGTSTENQSCHAIPEMMKISTFSMDKTVWNKLRCHVDDYWVVRQTNLYTDKMYRSLGGFLSGSWGLLIIIDR